MCWATRKLESMSVRLRRWCQRKSATSLTLPYRCTVQPEFLDTAGNDVYRHAPFEICHARTRYITWSWAGPNCKSTTCGSRLPHSFTARVVKCPKLNGDREALEGYFNFGHCPSLSHAAVTPSERPTSAMASFYLRDVPKPRMWTAYEFPFLKIGSSCSMKGASALYSKIY